MDQKVIDALNEQINLEHYSGYLYLGLSFAMEESNYKGYAKWLARHHKEELEHAKEFIDFMHMRGVKPTLKSIEIAEVDAKEPLEVAKLVLEHEKKVTQSIYNIHDVAKQANDYATEVFMHKFIEEQTEEEALALDVIDQFTLAGDDIAARIIIDRELCKQKHGDHEGKHKSELKFVIEPKKCDHD